MADVILLPEGIDTGIKEFLRIQWIEKGLDKEYPNIILRSDVLSVLDRYCKVIYYPLEDERNNGFHVERYSIKDNKKIHFVFLNSAQSIEKQNFTAAHELGHVWKVDEYICEQYKIKPNSDIKERIASRFAAELLMPEEQFKKQLKQCIDYDKEIRISIVRFIKIVAYLMNFFMAPMKAVMLRMVEIGAVKIETVNKILSTEELKPIIDIIINRTILEEGYIELQNGTHKKWIDGLADLLDKAEKKDSIAESKIQKLRDCFGIQKQDTAQCDELNSSTATVTFAEESEWQDE